MKLFFVTPLNQNPETNIDWFVIASSAKEAWALYRAEPSIDADSEADDDDCRIFEVPAVVTGPARVLEWHRDVILALGSAS